MPRVISKKYTAPDGSVYDSREEYQYLLILKADKRVSCIHRQVKMNIHPAIYMMVPKPSKRKQRYVTRTLVKAHTYKPDYIFWEGDRLIVCDVKSDYTRTLREFRITAKGVIAKIIEHNRKRHNGNAVVVFREAVSLGRGKWRIIDYPPEDCRII